MLMQVCVRVHVRVHRLRNNYLKIPLGKYLVRFNLAHIIQRVIVVVDNYYVTRFVVHVRKSLRHKLSYLNMSRVYSEMRRGAR